MLIHNAHFWLKKDLTAEQISMFESEVLKLATLSYLVRGFAGKPAGTEVRPVTDHSFSYSTSLHFKTFSDHNFYQTKCKDHARFVEKCEAFWERVVVYDISPLG